MTRLRLALLVDNLIPGGGAERLVGQIAVRLDRTRIDPFVVVTRPLLGPAADEVRASGVPIVVLDRTRPWELWKWRPLIRLLRRERIDVLHSHKFGSNLWGSLFGRLGGVPVVVAHEHTWSYEGQPLRRFLDREVIARLSDRFVAVSREDRRRMTSVEGIAPSKTLFLPIGVPPPAPATGRDVRAEVGAGPGDPVVGTVCGLRPQKALHVLIEAAAGLAPEFPSLRVVIAGEGEERPRLEELVAARGLGDVVTLLGFVPPQEVPDVVAALDVAVNSSDFEGSPLAVMEFMAGGKATVATRVGGTPDLIDDGVHGLLVPRGDSAALAAAIARLLRDPALRASLGERARERQRSEFDIDVFVRRLEQLYEELLNASGRARGRRPSAQVRGRG